MGSDFITVYPVCARSFALCYEGMFLISITLFLRYRFSPSLVFCCLH